MVIDKSARRGEGRPLRQRTIEQMRIANLAESAQRAYLFETERLTRRYGTSPADLDTVQLRDWVLKLIDRGLGPSSTNSTLAAFRFLYVETPNCPERVAGLPNRKKPRAPPRHMTVTEVERVILATPDLRHRAAFIAAYGAELRVSETVGVKVGAIKADRKRLHIPSGKSGAEKMAPLPDGLTHNLRSYWKNIWPRPASRLFNGASPDQPMRTTPGSAFRLQEGARQARHRSPPYLPQPASLDHHPSSRARRGHPSDPRRARASHADTTRDCVRATGKMFDTLDHPLSGFPVLQS